jgi:cysteine desulfurase
MGQASRVIPVGSDGLIDETELDSVLAEGPALVAIQQVNNETGVIQPLDRLAPEDPGGRVAAARRLCTKCGKLLLPDADFIAACAHKLGGPPGIGVLLVRDLATLEAVGGQEKGYRRGTPDVPMRSPSLRRWRRSPYDMDRIAALRVRMEEGLGQAGGVIIAEQSPRIATIGAYSLPGGSSASLLVQFDLAGIAVSAGSACASGQ